MIKKFSLFIAGVFFISFVSFGQQINKTNTKVQKNKTQILTNVRFDNQKNKAVDKNQKRLASSKIKREKDLKLSDKDYRINNNIPNSFPIYTETGDVVKDTRNYDISVKDWIKNNEKAYQKIKEIIKF